jgi:hypothetical protein
MASLERLEYLEDIRNGNWEKYFPADMAEFFRDFYNKHYSEIPRSRVDKVDWSGYGWPRLDSYGDLIGIGGTDPVEDGSVDLIVADDNGGEWIVSCESADDIPEGLSVTPSSLYDHGVSDLSELFPEDR